MDSTFLKNRITATELLIVAYETALTALVTDNVQEYRLDTGQTVTNVTKFDIVSMQKTLDALYNRLATLSARLNGGSVFVRPVF